MTKYEPLTEALRKKDIAVLRLSFPEIERIVGFPLPRSAFRHPAWWANNPTGHPHSKAWLKAGWKTEQLDLERKIVTFRKLSPSGGTDGPRSLYGALKGLITVHPGTDLTKPTGAQWKAQEGSEDD